MKNCCFPHLALPPLKHALCFTRKSKRPRKTPTQIYPQGTTKQSQRWQTATRIKCTYAQEEILVALSNNVAMSEGTSQERSQGCKTSETSDTHIQE